MIFGTKATASAGIIFILLVAGFIGSEMALDTVQENGVGYDDWTGMDSSYVGAATRRSTRRSSSGSTRTVAVAPGTEQPTTMEIAPREESLAIHFGTFPQCNDRIKNGEETDIDCGGSQCPACPQDKTCLIDRDCQSSNCFNGICGPQMCEPGRDKCQIGPDGKNTGTVEFCTEARRGWQLGQVCTNGCLDGKCPVDCAETDSGFDIYVAGVTTGAPLSNLLSSSQSNSDICQNGVLTEFSCETDSEGRKGVASEQVTCEDGCEGNACKECVANKGEPCNRNVCGGSGVVLCDGSCSAGAPNVPSNLNQPCNRNQCGGSGTIQCSGSCSAPAPSVPSNLGQACNRNQCGGSGTITCSGSCSAGAPNVPSNLGQPCNRNQCGGTGTITCSGSCSAGAPSVPSNYGQACNRNACGGSGTVTCSGSCSASAPSLTTSTEACNRNQCGGSGTRTVTYCNGQRTSEGACSAGAPYVPPNYGQACGCNGAGRVQCNGQCTVGACCETKEFLHSNSYARSNIFPTNPTYAPKGWFESSCPRERPNFRMVSNPICRRDNPASTITVSSNYMYNWAPSRLTYYCGDRDSFNNPDWGHIIGGQFQCCM